MISTKQLHCGNFARGNICPSHIQGPSAADQRGLISYSIKNRKAFCNKQLCKNVVSSPQVLVRKIKQIKMRWCVVLFWGPVLYKQKIIYHMTTNKNKYMTTSDAPVGRSVMSPPCFECQSSDRWLRSSGRRPLFRPFSFDSKKQLRERGGFGGAGGRGRCAADQQFVGWVLCMFPAHCTSSKMKLKCSSGLQLLSVSNRS